MGKYILYLFLAGLVLLIASSCTVEKGKKELVYHRDQNNRLYAITEVQHIKHEQVMDLMPMDKLVMMGKVNELKVIDTMQNTRRYNDKLSRTNAMLNLSFWGFTITIFLFLILFISEILDLIPDSPYLSFWELIYLCIVYGFLFSYLFSVATISIGLGHKIQLMLLKKKLHVKGKESRGHIFLTIFSIFAILLLIYGIIFIIKE